MVPKTIVLSITPHGQGDYPKEIWKKTSLPKKAGEYGREEVVLLPSLFCLELCLCSLVQKGAKLIPVRSFAEPSGKKIVVFPVLVIIYYYREYCTSNIIIKIREE